MSKIKVAVVGCGSIAIHRHVPEYAANPNVELVAFCDLNQDVAQKNGGSIRRYKCVFIS